MAGSISSRRKGGVKVVFDVVEHLVAQTTVRVTAAGFDVHPYYPEGRLPRRGGPGAGLVRLGAERATRTFTESEQAEIVTAFEAVRATHALACTVVGVDAWEAGGPDGSAGVRAARSPVPVTGPAAGMIELPS